MPRRNGLRLSCPLAILLVAGVVLCGCKSKTEGSQGDTIAPIETPTNLLMLSIDTMRRDHMGRYDHDYALTPFMDSVAEQSLVLDAHRSCSNWTFPAALCTLNGRYNLDDGFLPYIDGEYRVPTPARENLATWLQDLGYHTILSTANGWFYGEFNDPGFDVQIIPDRPSADKVFEEGKLALDEALAAGHDKWFMHLHFNNPHAPYDPPDSYLDELDELPTCPYDLEDVVIYEQITRGFEDLDPGTQDVVLAHLKARYRGEIMYMDDIIQRVWNVLADEGRLDETLVVVWTDHGEQFMEHGALGHGIRLLGPENDAIAFFWYPGIEARVRTSPTSHIDIVPTILDLMEHEIPELVTGQVAYSRASRRPLFGMAITGRGPVQSVMDENQQVLEYTWLTARLQYYDRARDPSQAHDLFDLDNPKVIELWNLLQPKVELMDELAEGYEATDPWTPLEEKGTQDSGE